MPEFLQTEIWLPGDSYPASAIIHREASRPLSNREIERMDYEVDMMLLGDLRNQSVASPFSSKQIEDLPEYMHTEVWLPGDTYPTAFK